MPDTPKLTNSETTSQTFLKAGNRYVSSTGTLTLHHRHQYTATKPRQYLMFYPAGGGSPKYLTGLYPQPDGGFIGENKGVYYRVTLTDDAITMLAVSGEGGKVL
jgi:hypothetical protein